MTTIAFVTCEHRPGITDDDQYVVQQLAAEGITVVPEIWSDHSVDWTQYAAVIIGSTWDYHHHMEEYTHWLKQCDQQGVKLFNTAEHVLANLHKSYLNELAVQGVPTIPSVHIAKLSVAPRLDQLMSAHGWDDMIIKPAVSASAYGLWRSCLSTSAHDQARFAQPIAIEDVLVQPYMKEVSHCGEWSVVFFAGEYSHSLLKRPAANDFRVQSHAGGKVILAQPPQALVDQAVMILSTMHQKPLYARVDGIEHNGIFTLMELEINEPSLFLGLSKEAPLRFCEAIELTIN